MLRMLMCRAWRLACFFSLYGTAPALLAQPVADSMRHSLRDSSQVLQLEDVIVIPNSISAPLKEAKALGSVDSYLDKSGAVNMIRRGAYGWEPMLNGMATERSVVTIDGMRVYHACTDKMDPITSYVENTNLSEAKISDGQAGAGPGGTIAGSIDLVRRRSGFTAKQTMRGSLFGGYESNNGQQIYGTALNYSAPRLFADIDFTHRQAINYHAGEQAGQPSEVKFSQFTKYNFSAITGYKINERQQLEASLIYDHANDVGYPGLPMDVALAEAVIGSLDYRYKNPSKAFSLWETKLYVNTVTHVMDDSHRPVVPIRMDMPGWTKTQGFHTALTGSRGKHRFKISADGHRNNSLAEMTMYPNDPGEKDMFMLTWPDVNTLYGGINMEDQVMLGEHVLWALQGGMGVQYNEVASKLGLRSLRIFYPDLQPSRTRLLPTVASHWNFYQGKFTHKIGAGFGSRAPTVSEAYGFYLLNVTDNYDYMGNPDLRNERSLSIDASTTYKNKGLTMRWKANWFRIMDYIIGMPREGYYPMNITASGVKVYEQLAHADLFNTGLEAEYTLTQRWALRANGSYRYGEGEGGAVLPLIQPFTYSVSLRYEKDKFSAEANVNGSSRNRNSMAFGETQKASYAIANASISKEFTLGKKRSLVAKAGVENILDTYYTTFSDWFGIPRPGRNFFGNLIFRF